MPYFSDRPIPPSELDSSTYKLVSDYKEKLFRRGLVGAFTSIDEFETNLYNNLVVNVRDLSIREFEEVEKSPDHKIMTIVGFDEETKQPIPDKEWWKYTPLTQFQREILVLVKKVGSEDPVTLAKFYGKEAVKGLISAGMLKLRNRRVEIYDAEVAGFISRYC